MPASALRAPSADLGVCAVLVAGLAARIALPGIWTDEHVAGWATIFGALCLQACPYIVLGALLSAVVTRLPARLVRRLIPRAPGLAVPIAALGAATIPGCECGAVSVAAALRRRGVALGPSIAVMLSGPATNPIVLIATATAFPGRPAVVWARVLTSFSVAVVIGWLAGRWSPADHVDTRAEHRHRPADELLDTLGRDLALFTIGAAAVASFTLLVPAGVIAHLGTNEWVAVPAMALLAVLLGVCSAADAFIAASFTGFPISAQLVFMTVGPVVDVKLVAMQIGTFGLRFTVRLALATFGCALLCAVGWSAVLL